MAAPGWYVLVGAVACLATALLCVPAMTIARRIDYVSVPSDRSVHVKPTPYGGGVAMFSGLCVALAVAAFLPGLHALFVDTNELVGVVLASGVILVVGLVDDLRNMSAPAKVAGEVLAASVLYFLGVTMYWLKIPFGGALVLGPSVTPLITAVWVIALTNAINLIDGLDGLAAGIVAIASGTLCAYGYDLQVRGLLLHSNVGPLVAALTCGVCLGFLPFNIHPARLFMGDAGALVLGVLMSASTMVIGGRLPPISTTGVTFFFFAPLLIPFFILGVPLVDMAFAIVRRTASGYGFQNADKDHIHHRLLRLGHGHRRTVVILWLWTALLSGMVLFPLYFSGVNVFIPFGVAGMGVALYTWFHPGLRRSDVVPRGAAKPTEPEPASVGGPTAELP